MQTEGIKKNNVEQTLQRVVLCGEDEGGNVTPVRVSKNNGGGFANSAGTPVGAALSVFGRASSSQGTRGDIPFGSDWQLLVRNNSALTTFKFYETSSKSSGYTVTTADFAKLILCDASSAAFTITLPSATSLAGFWLTIMKTNADTATTSNAVTIDADGTQTIGGALTNRLQAQNSYITIVADGSNWRVLAACDFMQSTLTSFTNFPSTTTYGDIISSFEVPPGEWDLTGTMSATLNGATMTGMRLGIGTSAGNTTTGLTEGINLVFTGADVPTATQSAGLCVPNFRAAITASPDTDYYLKVLGAFSSGPPQYVGRLSARRVR